MIIKALSRKTKSFNQLYSYIVCGATDKDFIIANNISLPLDRENVLAQFEKNSEYLKARKNGNYLYHEIISLPIKEEIPVSNQKFIIFDIANKYILERGKYTLAVGFLHLEPHHLHIHIMMSANERNSKKRLRLSKEKFNEIQKNLETYVQQEYPEIETPNLYNKPLEIKKSLIKTNEFEFIKRTGQKSKRQELEKTLTAILEQSKNINDFTERLKLCSMSIYVRGKYYGIINEITGIKYRLNKLSPNILKKYMDLLERSQEKKQKLSSEKELEIKERLSVLDRFQKYQVIEKNRLSHPNPEIEKRLQKLEAIERQKTDKEHNFENDLS